MHSLLAAAVVFFASEPVHLADGHPSAAMKGAVVVVKKANGAFVQGLVTQGDETHLVVDAIDIPAAEIASLYTVRPARFPAGVGNVVSVTFLAGGDPLTGRVLDLADDWITLQFENKDARIKWGAIRTLLVVKADGPEALALAMRTPEPVATPEPAPASARASYGERGTLELGGSFDFFSGSVHEETSISDASASGYQLDFRPFAGWFVVDGVELLGGLTLVSRAIDHHEAGDEWSTYAGVTAGAAYFVRRPSGIAWGPHVHLGSYSDGGESEDVSGISFDFEERGWTGDAGLTVRVPMGDSALLSTSFSFYQSGYTFDYYPGGPGSSGTGRRNGFQTTVGVSFWGVR